MHPEMNKAPTPASVRASRKARNQRRNFTASLTASRFAGTTNPRHLRVLAELERGPLPRRLVDRVADAANGPALVRQLRRLGLDVPCFLIPTFDRDARARRPGVYALSRADRVKLAAWRHHHRTPGGLEQ